jgi:GMP synthase (glutamine-hydrolysing)
MTSPRTSRPVLLIVEQQPDAPAGVLEQWASAREVATRVVRPAQAQPLPPPRGSGYDAVAVLGSDRSVHASADPWVTDQIAWLPGVAEAGVPVLGLCFGGQALAAALGGVVTRLERPEIGWVTLTGPRAPIAAGPWFEWHEDGFTTPPGAEELARSAAGAQAFALGPHLGLQFHPEVTPAIVAGWVQAGGRQLAEQAIDERALASETARNAPAAREAAFALFDAWAARPGGILATGLPAG